MGFQLVFFWFFFKRNDSQWISISDGILDSVKVYLIFFIVIFLEKFSLFLFNIYDVYFYYGSIFGKFYAEENNKFLEIMFIISNNMVVFSILRYKYLYVFVYVYIYIL